MLIQVSSDNPMSKTMAIILAMRRLGDGGSAHKHMQTFKPVLMLNPSSVQVINKESQVGRRECNGSTRLANGNGGVL